MPYYLQYLIVNDTNLLISFTVHNNLKTTNILISSTVNGGKERIILSDFTKAFTIPPTTSNTHLTASSTRTNQDKEVRTTIQHQVNYCQY